MANMWLTLVFTDLVNSTAIKSLLPGQDLGARNQAYVENILSPHQRRIEAHLRESEGRIVKNLGDGFFLVFNDLVKAVRWAIDLQRSQQQDPIATPLGPLELKIGLHVGTPASHPFDRGDYLGREVDFAARLADLSSGRQIVVSELVAVMLREAQMAGVSAHAQGMHEVKGIGRVPVYELLWEGQAPRKLKQKVASPTNLPPPPVTFIGRDDLIDKVHECLRAGGLTVLKGEGGMGKTALSLHVAHKARDDDEFPGGVAWINCELEPSREECLRRIAHIFFGDRMEHDSLDECQARILEHLHRNDSLVVLDNFETVADDVEMLRYLASLRPPARVLVTTRELPPGLGGHVVPVGELPAGESVALFIERATRAGFDTTGREDEIQEICVAVGGQPLAIELLAARSALLPLSRLIQRVRIGPDVIAAPADPTRSDRHQSLRRCMELSFTELGTAASDLLLRLSVFPDGASPAVLTAVLGTEDWEDAAGELVAASVWRLAGNRYTIHPLLRQIALEKLGLDRDADEAEAARALVRFVKMRAEQARKGPADLKALKAALDWCEAELRNLIATADLAYKAEDWESVFHLSAAIFNFFQVRGHWNDAEHLLTIAREATRRAGNRSGEALTLNHLGLTYLRQGRWTEAESSHRESLLICRELRDTLAEGNTLKHLGRLLQLRERLDESEAVCVQALDLLRQAGDPVGQAKTLMYLGNVYRFQERWKETALVYEQGLQLSRRIGDRYDEGDLLRHLGQVYQHQHQWDQAKLSLQKSLAIWRAFDDRHREAVILEGLGAVFRDEGRWTEAEAMIQQSLAVFQELHDRRKEGGSLLNLARLREFQGNIPAALELARQAVSALEHTEDAWSIRQAREFAEHLSHLPGTVNPAPT
jgi:class 3 adenylate cyclase/tetratricopeptide (TPR) repeat protein